MDQSAKYLIAVILWILWCVLHSALIATTVTDFIKRKVGDKYRFYRLFYNTISVVTLIPLMYYSISIRQGIIFHWQGNLVIVKYMLLITSIALFIAGARHYSMSQFLGIHQIKTGRSSQALSDYETFNTSGILQVVRHPWYTAAIMAVWARDLSLSIILVNIIICSYFIFGTFLEEKKLVLEFGERYREYQNNVSMLIPYKWAKAMVSAGKKS